MYPSRTSIELKEGVVCYLRITPALYGVATMRGIDLNAKDENPLRKYVKVAYCAAINDWEIERVDNPTIGVFPFKYSDFEDWAWADTKRLYELVDFILLATTGKGMKHYTDEEVKKKSRK